MLVDIQRGGPWRRWPCLLPEYTLWTSRAFPPMSRRVRLLSHPLCLRVEAVCLVNEFMVFSNKVFIRFSLFMSVKLFVSCHIQSNRKTEKIEAGSYHWDAAEVELFCSSSIILPSAFVCICFEIADKIYPPTVGCRYLKTSRQKLNWT